MGWGRWLLLGDLGQQLDLSDQRAELSEVRERLARERFNADDVSKRLAALHDENDELKIYLAALIRLLQEKRVCTRDEIAAFVKIIDKEDGLEDDKFRGKIT